jgi:hypothetical protein
LKLHELKIWLFEEQIHLMFRVYIPMLRDLRGSGSLCVLLVGQSCESHPLTKKLIIEIIIEHEKLCIIQRNPSEIYI